MRRIAHIKYKKERYWWFDKCKKERVSYIGTSNSLPKMSNTDEHSESEGKAVNIA